MFLKHTGTKALNHYPLLLFQYLLGDKICLLPESEIYVTNANNNICFRFPLSM